MGVSKSFRTGSLEREMQMVQLSAITCSCIAILWVSLVSFAAIILCVASQRVIPKVSVYIVIHSARKLSDTPSYNGIYSKAVQDDRFANLLGWRLTTWRDVRQGMIQPVVIHVMGRITVHSYTKNNWKFPWAQFNLRRWNTQPNKIVIISLNDTVSAFHVTSWWIKCSFMMWPFRSWGSSVSIVNRTGCMTGARSQAGIWIFFSSPLLPDWLWPTPRLRPRGAGGKSVGVWGWPLTSI
jgi:hypothetical protein